MAAVGFVTLLKNFSVRKLLFGVALLALMIFLVICITYTLKHSPWFLLGALPFLLSVMVCYEGFYKSKPNLLSGLHQLRSVSWFRVSLFKTVLGLELLF